MESNFIKALRMLKAMMAEFGHASCGSFGDAAKAKARAALRDAGEEGEVASIIQAAKWMREGKNVRRKKWMPDCHSYCADGDDEVIVATSVSKYIDGFDVEDLLADDWEIAE